MLSRSLDLLCRTERARPLLTGRDYAILAILTSCALALRLIGLNQGLWFDEIATLVAFARRPIQEIIVLEGSANNHVLYSILAHVSHLAFGESAWSLRLPAVLLGTATVPALYYFGLQIASRREALLAATFLMCSYHHVWFSQSARGYTGALLAAVVLSIIFVRMLYDQRSSGLNITAYVLVAAMGVWIHLTTTIVVVAHGIVWLGFSMRHWRSPREINWRPAIAVVGSGLLSMVLNANILAILLRKYIKPVVRNTEQILAFEQVGSSAPDYGDWLLTELALGLTKAFPGGTYMLIPLALLLAIVVAAGIWSYARQSWVSWGLLTLPFLIWIAGMQVLNQVVLPRFLLACAAFLLMIGVRGGYVIARFLLPSVSMKHISAIGLTMALLTALAVPRAWQPKQDLEDARRFIDENVGPDDALVCNKAVRAMFQLYLGMDKCLKAPNVHQLIKIESTHKRTWYAHTLMMGKRRGPFWRRLHDEYTVEKVAASSVNLGEIVILVHNEGDDLK